MFTNRLDQRTLKLIKYSVAVGTISFDDVLSTTLTRFFYSEY